MRNNYAVGATLPVSRGIRIMFIINKLGSPLLCELVKFSPYLKKKIRELSYYEGLDFEMFLFVITIRLGKYY